MSCSFDRLGSMNCRKDQHVSSNRWIGLYILDQRVELDSCKGMKDIVESRDLNRRKVKWSKVIFDVVFFERVWPIQPAADEWSRRTIRRRSVFRRRSSGTVVLRFLAYSCSPSLESERGRQCPLAFYVPLNPSFLPGTEIVLGNFVRWRDRDELFFQQ